MTINLSVKDIQELKEAFHEAILALVPCSSSAPLDAYVTMGNDGAFDWHTSHDPEVECEIIVASVWRPSKNATEQEVYDLNNPNCIRLDIVAPLFEHMHFELLDFLIETTRKVVSAEEHSEL